MPYPDFTCWIKLLDRDGAVMESGSLIRHTPKTSRGQLTVRYVVANDGSEDADVWFVGILRENGQPVSPDPVPMTEGRLKAGQMIIKDHPISLTDYGELNVPIKFVAKLLGDAGHPGHLVFTAQKEEDDTNNRATATFTILLDPDLL